MRTKPSTPAEKRRLAELKLLLPLQESEICQAFFGDHFNPQRMDRAVKQYVEWVHEFASLAGETYVMTLKFRNDSKN
jgi:hypothetical protein